MLPHGWFQATNMILNLELVRAAFWVLSCLWKMRNSVRLLTLESYFFFSLISVFISDIVSVDTIVISPCIFSLIKLAYYSISFLFVGGYFELDFCIILITFSERSSELLTVSIVVVVDIQLLNHVQLFVTPWTAACQASLSFTIFQSSLKFMFIVSVMLSNHLILCCPLLLPSVFPSIRVFSSELALYIRWPKCWSIFIIHCSVSLHVFTIVLFFYDAGVLWLLGSLLWIHLCVLFPSTLLLRTMCWTMSKILSCSWWSRFKEVLLFWFSRLLLFIWLALGNGTPLQYSCLENPMDGGAW